MNIMLDLETLSSQPNAAIVSIGACSFSNDKPIEEWFRQEFYMPVSGDNGHLDPQTISWWAKQSDTARAVLHDDNAVPVVEALNRFAEWACTFSTNPMVWGNGATFDNVVLRECYKRHGLFAPWSYRNDMCYRTLKNLRPDISFEPHGTAHNALDDAIAQARHAERIFAALNN